MKNGYCVNPPLFTFFCRNAVFLGWFGINKWTQSRFTWLDLRKGFLSNNFLIFKFIFNNLELKFGKKIKFFEFELKFKAQCSN